MSEEYFHSFPNRTLCDVLAEMRKCDTTRNYAYLLSLIEEAQHYANRMESALADKRDIREWSDMRSKLKDEIKELRNERRQLQPSTSSKDVENP
jgi:hypothetical protein